MAYFFGKKLEQTLHVPIGLIESCWGGTAAETWTPATLVEFNPVLSEATSYIKPAPWWPHKPGSAYNAMIAPLTHFGIAGAIWYQGESNAMSYPYTYNELFKTMVNAWRIKWGKVFPFYYVQIAPFTGYKTNTAAILREQQTLGMQIRETGMVVTTDLIDDIHNIHPRHKKEVGYRLANWALSETYNLQKIPFKSPSYKRMSIEKNKIRIYFNDIGSGLICKGPSLTSFQIAGDDQHFVDARARIEKNMVIVWSDDVKKPVAIRFAFSNAPQPHLFSKDGLPLIPFRTDSWTVNTSEVKGK